jgi:signal transduction histidine kinase
MTADRDDYGILQRYNRVAGFNNPGNYLLSLKIRRIRTMTVSKGGAGISRNSIVSEVSPDDRANLERATLHQIRKPSRLAVLRGLGILDSPEEESFDRISRLAARLLKAPVALVSLIDANRQYFKSAVGLVEPWQSSRETPLESSFCKYVVKDGAPLAINDARTNPAHRGNPAIGTLGVVAYLGCPLVYRGEVLGALCIIDNKPREWSEEDADLIRDLTAMVVTEIELREIAQERKAALRDRDRLFAVVCNDLRRPMQSIMTSLALLDLDASSRDARRAISALRRSSRQMNRLIADLVDTGTPTFDRFGIELRRLDIGPVLRKSATAHAQRAKDCEIELTTRLEAAPAVLADRDGLEKVMSNILDNAIRFTPAGGSVEIRCKPRDFEVQVSVSDSGPGIPKEDLEDIFDWFWHAGRNEGSGTGLGLSIAKGIIDAHGGRIWASNLDPHGAEISFALPLADWD